MCLVNDTELSHWYPDFGNIQQSLLTWLLILVLRGNLLIFLIGRMIFLLPFPDTKSLFVTNFPFLTQPWSWILCINIAFLWLMIKQKQKEKKTKQRKIHMQGILKLHQSSSCNWSCNCWMVFSKLCYLFLALGHRIKSIFQFNSSCSNQLNNVFSGITKIVLSYYSTNQLTIISVLC